MCVSSLHRGHANMICIVSTFTDDPRRESNTCTVRWKTLVGGARLRRRGEGQRMSSKGGIGAITQTSLDLVYNNLKVTILHHTDFVDSNNRKAHLRAHASAARWTTELPSPWINQPRGVYLVSGWLLMLLDSEEFFLLRMECPTLQGVYHSSLLRLGTDFFCANRMTGRSIDAWDGFGMKSKEG